MVRGFKIDAGEDMAAIAGDVRSRVDGT